MATKYDPLSYGEVLRLTEGHGTSEIYDRIQHALAARPVAALARVLISRADAKRFVERWAGGPVHELTDGTAPAGTLGDLVARLAVRQSPSPSGDADARVALTFDALRDQDVPRCNESFPPHTLESWSLTDWAAALAGEVGEACNAIKKIRRGDYALDERRNELADELADVVTYCDLLAARAGIDLGEAVARKFNAVSERVGSPRRLALTHPPVATKETP